MPDYDVVRVRTIGARRLHVEFADGLAGEVEFGDTFFRGVFEVLREEEAFARVRCDGGYVEWPGDLDLAPDAMHDAIKAHGRWLLD